MSIVRGRFHNDPIANTKLQDGEVSQFEKDYPEITEWAMENTNSPTFQFVANYSAFKLKELNTIYDETSDRFFSRSIDHKRLAYCLFTHMMGAFKVIGNNLDQPKTVGVPLGEAKASMKCSESKKDRIIKDGKDLGYIEEKEASWNLNVKLIYLSGKEFIHAFQKQVNDIPIGKHYRLKELRQEMDDDVLAHVKFMDQFERLK